MSVVVDVAPPPLPFYAQPPVPSEGYIWTPGYRAFQEGGYFWNGCWGSSVGFYGGLNYGYGYTGHVYQGGRWDHGAFLYNRRATNVNPTLVHSAYAATVTQRTRWSHTSFNGGPAGMHARPSLPEASRPPGRCSTNTRR